MGNTFSITDRKLTIWAHVAFWLVLGGVNLLLSNWFIDPQMNLWRAFINQAFLAFLFYANAWLVNRFLEKKKYASHFFLVNGLVVATVPLRFYINQYFLGMETAGSAVSDKSLWFGAFATGYGIVMLSTIYQLLANRFAEERKALALSNQEAEAELKFLRAQINPHFLFNTLNNIYSLAVARSPKTADMVLKLSQLLRYVVYEQKGKTVPLEKEVQHIRHFIELFEMRSEHPLNIEFTVEGKLEGIQIEPMILIPIVENCFKHCDFDTNEKAFVRMNLTVLNKEFTLLTHNSKNDADRQKDHTGGVGLENIRRRLELRHPNDFQLRTTDNGKDFEVYFLLKT